jgi:hypothetical protein
VHQKSNVTDVVVHDKSPCGALYDMDHTIWSVVYTEKRGNGSLNKPSVEGGGLPEKAGG